MAKKLQMRGQNTVAAVSRVFEPKTVSLSSDGSTRVYSLSRRTQFFGALVTAALLGMSAYSAGNALDDWRDKSAETYQHNAKLAAMKTEMAAMRARMAGLSTKVEAEADRLEKRQKFLASLFSGEGDLDKLVADLPRKRADKVETASLGAAHASLMAPLTAFETEQLAFVDQATTATRARLKETQGLVRKLGLDPSRLVRQTSLGMGGPLEDIDPKHGPEALDPRFKDLFISWKKLDLLEKAVSAIPSVVPTRSFTYSSGFGVRYDPFNGSAAVHAGVDMAGRVGTPVYASADGVVDRAGPAGAYGNMIQVEHGNGIATRYGHLSRVMVRPGDRIKQGELIGKMGSTGRSTGSHLHYEVRIDGRAVDPMPFLKKGSALVALQERGLSVGQGGPVEERPAEEVALSR